MTACKKGDKIILPRNVHRSVINALIIGGGIPVYVKPQTNQQLGIALGMSIDEVNEPNLWESDVWSFTTIDSFIVDDMDTYTVWHVADNNIFEVWIDGAGNCADIAGNGTGSILSVQEASPAQGKSMKYEYDNDGMVRNPCDLNIEEPRDKYSEAKANVADLPSGIGSD